MTKKKPSALHLKRGDSASARARKQLKADGWMNVYTGQGIKGVDKQLGTSFGYVRLFQEKELTDLYRGDGLARRVVDLPTGEMVRAGWFIHGDTDGDILKYMKRLRVKQKVLMALRWARLYGGALVVMHINDGGMMEDPIREEGVRNIEALHVYNRYRVTWTNADLYTDANNPKFGQVEYYTINPVGLGGMQPYRIHESRCLLFDGLPVDDMSRQENNGWGDSIMQVVFKQLSDLTGTYHASRNIIDDFIQTILKIDNLQELLMNNQEALIRKRLEIIDMGRAIQNTILIDKNEEYSKVASSVAGLADLLQKHAEVFSAVTDIPMTLLMGQSAGGFNSKDEGSMQKWYDKIDSMQEDDLLPNLERIAYVCMLAKQGPTKGKIIEDWELEFHPLFQMSELQITEMRNKQAETDKTYIETGVLTPDIVAISRFGGDDYSLETHIEVGDIPEPTNPDDME